MHSVASSNNQTNAQDLLTSLSLTGWFMTERLSHFLSATACDKKGRLICACLPVFALSDKH